jgi:alpha-beta hydrolase superfamily lysophospholipase
MGPRRRKLPVGNMGKGVVEMRDLYENSGIKDITLRLYEGDRHEILNETDRDVVYADIAEWAEKLI